RKQHSRNDVWHLDEVVITIAGRKHWLWRAVDRDGNVLDAIVQNRRNTKAVKRLLTRLLKKQGVAPKRMITDKLRSWSSQATGDAGRRASVAQGIEQPVGECTCAVAKTGAGMMQGFRSPGRLQRFVSIFSALRNS
ncbi:IS6 family transposase, partial [Mesorhizobium sp. M2D.F.Ca.ET.178.01.1.1]|uniref:DDE-type integrase/transposase/recombinase n=1 Tax=Mesorhizobium sp. M2D.F.Ca.ET.178.01.1.1 TaxID=2563937 RepID=UPI001091B2E4